MVSKKNKLHGAVLHKIVSSGAGITLIEQDNDYGVYKVTIDAKSDFQLLVKYNTTFRNPKQGQNSGRYVYRANFSDREKKWLKKEAVNKAIAIVSSVEDGYRVLFVAPDRFNDIQNIEEGFGYYLVPNGSFWINEVEMSFPESNIENYLTT